jgi:hypothetical protein
MNIEEIEKKINFNIQLNNKINYFKNVFQLN